MTSLAVLESVGIWPASILQLAACDSAVVGEETALGRTRRARPVRVVGASVARTHEELRLRKPSHRAAQVRAVNSEHLELI